MFKESLVCGDVDVRYGLYGSCCIFMLVVYKSFVVKLGVVNGVVS